MIICSKTINIKPGELCWLIPDQSTPVRVKIEEPYKELSVLCVVPTDEDLPKLLDIKIPNAVTLKLLVEASYVALDLPDYPSGRAAMYWLLDHGLVKRGGNTYLVTPAGRALVERILGS